MPLPNLLNILGPLLFPTGSASSTIRPATPMQFDGEQPAAGIPDLTQLEDYVGSQERNTARNAALENAEEISSSIYINAEVNNIMERNKIALGLTAGPNGFYDINLVHPASPDPDRPGSADKEPDGFRLYLIAPPRPAVGVVAAALGNVVKTGADKLQSEIDSTVKAVKDLKLVELPAILDQAGNKASAIGTAIKKYMDDAGTGFDASFDKYVANAYSGATGNSFYSIVLPMPRELTETHSHNTDTLMLNALYRVATGVGIGLGNFGNSLGSRFGETHARRRTGQSGGLIQDIAEAVTLGLAAPAAELGNYAIDNAKARFGVGLNPNVETIYAAPAPRQFQFTFELYVKSTTEAKQVKEFIQTLKQHSYPFATLGVGGQNQLYIYPGEVYFEFSGRFRNNLFRSLRPCLITNINVQYSNQEQYQHFEDGSSIVYVVSMTLLENKLLDRNILVDDAADYAASAFDNDTFRDAVKFKDTFMGQKFQDALNDPAKGLNELGGALGLGDIGNDIFPPVDRGPGPWAP